MDVVALHTCKGSRCDASPRNTPTDNATEGILRDRYRDTWGHGMPPNVRGYSRARRMVDQRAILLARRGGARC
jgi:hypothetical protein